MRAELVPGTAIDLEKWDALVQSSPQGTVFAESWYINAILPQWHAIMVYDEDNELQGAMPLYLSQRSLIKYSLQPILAKYWGMLFTGRSFKDSYKEFAWKKKVLDAVVSAIPSNLARTVIYCHPSFDYGLPFAQHGFSLGTRYTYRLKLDGEEDVKKGFAVTVNQKVNKAKKAGFEARIEPSIEPVMDLINKNAKQGRAVLAPTYFTSFRKLAAEGYKRGQAFTLTVFNDKNEAIASSILLQDTKCVYFLVGLTDPDFRQTGANPLLLSEILSEARLRSKEFDFLGSMTESIESFFRSFGGRPVPYLTISKNKYSFLPI
jgi:hypothetical protein